MASFTITDLKKDQKDSFSISDIGGKEPYDIPSWQASAMNVGQALSFGFGDEIAGKLGADPARYRATIDQFKKDYPGSAMLGTVSGSMLIPFGAGKIGALKGTSPWATAAITGAGQGALIGAGESAGEGSKLAQDTLLSSGTGFLAGPLMLGGLKGAGSVANAVAPYVPGLSKNTERLARNRVVDAFSRDSVTPDQVGRNMANLGPEARIADAAGENTRGLLDLNANMPGKTKDQLEEVIRNRIASRPERMDSMVYSVSGGMGRAGSMEKALTKQQIETSGPLYRQLHSLEIQGNERLVDMLKAAKSLGAFGTAKKIADAERVPFSLTDGGGGNAVFGAGGAPAYGNRFSMRDLDLVKRGIDDLIESQTDAVTGKVTTLGRSYVGLKKDLLAELDQLTTKDGTSLYRTARDAFAGPAAMKSAISKGRSFWNENAERIDDLMDGMAQSEQQAFRIGAAEALREKIGKQTGQTQLINAWKDRTIREKLKALLGDDVKYSEVEQMLKNEATLKRMEGLGASRNSRTFSRDAGAEQQTLDNAQDLVNMGVAAKTGAIPQLIGGLSKFTSRVGTPEPVRDSIGSILLQQYKPEELKALEAALEALKKMRASAAMASGAAGGAAGKGVNGLLD